MLTTNIQLILIMCSLLSMIGLMLNKNHLLVSLLFLESFMLNLVVLIPLTLSIIMSQSMFISIILLSIAACEASMGLALMVMMSRSYGSDMMNLLSINKC